MNKSICTIYMVFLFGLITSSGYSQIEDPEQVDAFLLENRNLKKVYANFPNAMHIYKESESDKANGILLESLGVGGIITGGYIFFRGLSSDQNNTSGYNFGLPDFSSLSQVIVLSFGFIVGLTGATIFASGSNKLSIARIRRRGSAQQYIWDVEALTLQNEVGVISIGFYSYGVGLVFDF